MSQRIATGLAASLLPDIVRMGAERVMACAADEILDEDAAEAMIANIGMDDFRAGPLVMVTNWTTGKYAAVSFDGWIQTIWYRAGVFEETGLDRPVTWDAINAACDAWPLDAGGYVTMNTLAMIEVVRLYCEL